MIQYIAPHKYHNEYKNIPPKDDDILIISCNQKVLCGYTETEVFLPTVAEAESLWNVDRAKMTFLLSIDEQDFFLWNETVDETEKYRWTRLMTLRGLQPYHISFGAAVGCHLAHWYESNHFCGKCGGRLVHKADQRALVCPECGQMTFPRLNPIVITAVLDGEKMLVAKYNKKHHNTGNNQYVLLAGYVEIGESYEDTVRREIKEETGLDITELHYVGSQPWPFTDTVIAGFYAKGDSSLPLNREEEELSELVWVDRKDLPPRNTRTSMTDHLIELFRAGEESSFIR